MSQALYRKYRPGGWDQVFGQSHVIRTIQNAILSDRVGHAYLFAGPRGTGKTSTARLLAKAVNCLAESPDQRPCNECANCVAVNEGRFLDLIEIDAASNTSVEDVRDLRDKINFSPSQGTYKIYIIDEVHMLSNAAFNALLKTLEEPPAHAIFILATTEVHKIPATVLSRCQRHAFRRIPVADIVAQLKVICEGEGFDIPDEVLQLIARQSNGGMRDAISLLDQLTSTGEALSLELAQEVLGTATNQAVIELTDAILDRNGEKGLKVINEALDGGSDARQFSRQVVEYLRDLLLVRNKNSDKIDATEDVRIQMARQANAFELERLIDVIRFFNQSASDRNTSWFPGLPLELALAESIEEKIEPMVLAMPAHVMEAATPTQQAPAHSTAKPTPTAQQPEDSSPETDEEDLESEPMDIGDGKTIDIHQIHQNWERLRRLVRNHDARCAGLLNSCKPIQLKDGILVLGFQSEVVRSKMEDGKNIDLTRRAILHMLKAKVKIRTIVMSGKIDLSAMDPKEAASGGMVGEALNLGGRIEKKE